MPLRQEPQSTVRPIALPPLKGLFIAVRQTGTLKEFGIDLTTATPLKKGMDHRAVVILSTAAWHPEAYRRRILAKCVWRDV